MTGNDSNWEPTAEPGILKRRAKMLRLAREFLAARSILEVETPALTNYGVTDPNIASLATRLAGCGDRTYLLHTSPEYAMKRLLAAESPDIYQICKVFRDHEIGRVHQPEFTMAEWYRQGVTLEEMICETCAFITEVGEIERVSVDQYHYRDLFFDVCHLDPLQADGHQLADCAGQMVATMTAELHEQLDADRNAWLDLLMSHVVVPGLATERLSVIHHFPADQAGLARLDPDEPEFAERFEVFFNNIELANGYRELTDAVEQRHRFTEDLSRRHDAGLTVMEPDRMLLAALESGLPECSGVAVGFDRLVMAACGLKHIKQAVSFAL